MGDKANQGGTNIYDDTSNQNTREKIDMNHKSNMRIRTTLNDKERVVRVQHRLQKMEDYIIKMIMGK